MEMDEKRRNAMVKIIAPMGREELAVLRLYTELLGKTNDEDAWYLCKRMISDSAHHLTLDTEMLVKLAPGPRTGKKASRKELEGLLKQLDVAEKLELEAYKMYDDAIPEIEEPDMKGTATWIRNEEERHAQLVRELKETIRKKLEKK